MEDGRESNPLMPTRSIATSRTAPPRLRIPISVTFSIQLGNFFTDIQKSALFPESCHPNKYGDLILAA